MQHNVISSNLKRFFVPDVDIDYSFPPKPLFKLTSEPKKLTGLVREVEYTIEHSISFGDLKAIDIEFVLLMQIILRYQEIPPDKDLVAVIEDIFDTYTDKVYPKFEETHLGAVKFDLTKAKEKSLVTFKEAIKKFLN